MTRTLCYQVFPGFSISFFALLFLQINYHVISRLCSKGRRPSQIFAKYACFCIQGRYTSVGVPSRREQHTSQRCRKIIGEVTCRKIRPSTSRSNHTAGSLRCCGRSVYLQRLICRNHTDDRYTLQSVEAS